jgi:hypothetical protein
MVLQDTVVDSLALRLQQEAVLCSTVLYTVLIEQYRFGEKGIRSFEYGFLLIIYSKIISTKLESNEKE